MSALLVIVPTRGRPDRFATFLDAWNETTSGDAQLLVCLDSDDPTLGDYPLQAVEALGHGVTIGPPDGFAPRLTAEALIRTGHYALASFGDDHLPRSPDWDASIIEAMHEMDGPGIVYPNDLWQGSSLPTAPVLAADLVRALGFYSPPCLSHSYIDNFWLELGLRLGRIRYLHNVVIEHVHPAASKGAMDETYAAAHSREAEDGEAWQRYVESGELAADVARVEAAIR